ncbi:hypothetical protein, partial [Mesorhizobium sp. M0619]|uniref:hypothetical protein n=1 Tax=unclassified Mesorhizobium TaxID=325217 RepID=UPI00333A564A
MIWLLVPHDLAEVALVDLLAADRAWVKSIVPVLRLVWLAGLRRSKVGYSGHARTNTISRQKFRQLLFSVGERHRTKSDSHLVDRRNEPPKRTAPRRSPLPTRRDRPQIERPDLGTCEARRNCSAPISSGRSDFIESEWVFYTFVYLFVVSNTYGIQRVHPDLVCFEPPKARH